MRRDYFTLELQNVDDGGDEQPEAHISFEGPTDLLTDRLSTEGDVDVAFRYQTGIDEGGDAAGVFSVTDRMTGDFVLEVNADADDVRTLVDAARGYGQRSGDTDGCYRVTLAEGGETVFETDKRTLLVYDDEGSLLRKHSLIPSGVEL